TVVARVTRPGRGVRGLPAGDGVVGGGLARGGLVDRRGNDLGCWPGCVSGRRPLAARPPRGRLAAYSGEHTASLGRRVCVVAFVVLLFVGVAFVSPHLAR